MKVAVFDIETDGLLEDVTQIHCIAIQWLDGHSCLYTGDDIEDGLAALSHADVIAGHNIKGYDIPAIQKLYPTWTYKEAVDTLILGNILLPEEGTMSLETWAKKLRLSTQKVQHEDWSTYTPAMGERCSSDVEINVATLQWLQQHTEYEMIAEALDVEQKVSRIHANQVQYGVRFDVLKAVDLLYHLDEKIEERRKVIVKDAPRTIVIPGVPKKRQVSERESRCVDIIQNIIPHGTCTPFKKDGNYNVATKKYFGEPEVVHENGKRVRKGGYLNVQGSYTKIEVKEFNPNSKDEVKALLLSLGWKPTEYNFKKNKDGSFAQDYRGQRIPTSPKLTEDSYGSLPPGLGKTIAEFDMMNHRRRFLLNQKDISKGALAAVRDRGDGRVCADGFTCGTPTSRYRHKGVVCNIPRPSSPYGKEIRELFTVEEGNKLVGVDLSGIEARMLAHFLLRGNYTGARETADLILSPDKKNDFHSYNAQQWGVTRDIAKNGLYALLYGAGAAKLANTLGKPESMGARLKKSFFKAHPGIEELISDLETALSRNGGYIKGIDGRPLYIRSGNKLLNSLLQASAAYVFKKWMVRLDEVRGGSSFFRKYIHQVIAYHDELQFEIEALSDGTPSLAPQWAEICERMAIEIGKELDIKVPIEAEAKIGVNWKECH